MLAEQISGIGGVCRLETPRTLSQAFLVYSGGFLAQLLLLILALSYVAAFGFPPSLFGECLAVTFIVVNLLVLVGNIIPAKARAWSARPVLSGGPTAFLRGGVNISAP